MGLAKVGDSYGEGAWLIVMGLAMVRGIANGNGFG